MNHVLLEDIFSEFYINYYNDEIHSNKRFLKDIDNPNLIYTHSIGIKGLNLKLKEIFEKNSFNNLSKITFLNFLINHLKIEIESINNNIEYLKKNERGIEQENLWFIDAMNKRIKYCEIEILALANTNTEIIKNDTQTLNYQSQLNTFHIISSSQKDYLKDIHSALIKNGYIQTTLNLFDFKKLFNGSNTTDVKPIDWQKSIASLNYFLSLFKFNIEPKQLQTVTAKVFTVKNKIITLEQIGNNKQVSKKDKDKLNNIFKNYPNTMPNKI